MSVAPTNPNPLPQASPIALLAKDIKLAHSVFALPFALLGGVYAIWSTPPSGQPLPTQGDWLHRALQLALVIACMVLARTWAMLVNRIADRSFDAANPRTKRRALASGLVPSATARDYALACAIGFLACASGFWWLDNNPWPVLLALPVLAWIGAYSYAKRFTWLCHLWLGASLAAAPICAAIALNPPALWPPTPPTIWLLAAFVFLWVAGFDIIYALQDQDFDRVNGLHSIPARFGWRGALHIARCMHLLAITALVIAWKIEPAFHWLWGAAVFLTIALLATEHAIMIRLEAHAIRPRTDGTDNPPPSLNLVFFTLNGVLSCAVGLLGITQLLVSSP